MWPSSVPTMKMFSVSREKSKHVPPDRPISAASGSSLWSAVSSMVNFMTSENCSSFLVSDHCVTRPSDEMEKKDRLSALADHRISHTGSVCLPVLTLDAKMGFSFFSLFFWRRSKTHTVPS